MSESLNYIEAYFKGQLSDAEKRQFEQQCVTDEAFAADVAFYITAREAIRETLLEEKRDQWEIESKGSETINIKSAIVRNMKFGRWVAYATAACLILVASLYFLNIPETPEQLASNYIKQNYTRLSQTMDGATDSLQVGIAAYNTHNYKKALAYFERIYQAHPDNSDAKMYTGLSYLWLKDYDRAIVQFEELAATKNLEVNSGLFLKAVTLLHRKKAGDRENAKKLLEQVVKDSMTESAQASKLLEDWER